MGWFWGSDEENNIESTGTVNNNVIIDGQVDVSSKEIILLLGIICLLKIIEFVYFVYKRHYQGIKKRFAGTQNVQLEKIVVNK